MNRQKSLILTLTFLLLTAFSGCASAPKDEKQEPLEPEKLAEVYTDAQSRREIVYGMTMDQVSEAWGAPGETEMAGHLEGYGDGRAPAGETNQRWIYREGVGAKRYGTAATRVLYFESGHLVGWETR